MSKKIAFIGAGSFGFTRGLVRDILTHPALQDCTIALMDIHPGRLQMIKQAVERIIREGHYPAKLLATRDRKKALEGADGVLVTILAGGVNVWRYDIEIPKQYGVDINIGDTRGPSGIFRALRTIPVMLSICRDIERYCPKATLLNYTNPMAMLCRTMQAASKVKLTGLCHSVQGTAHMLAEWIGAPIEETSYLCAGINHQAWYLNYKWNGEDAYPLICKAITTNPKVYNAEQVRNEMYLHLGYYVTESSGHNSEYNAWFRKRPDLIKKYCTKGTNWNPGHYAYIMHEYMRMDKVWKKEYSQWIQDPKPLDLSRGHEYAASIFNAIFGDHTMFEFNGNVRNFGLIDNLPWGACVEVPILASKRGLDPLKVGRLPESCAILNNISAGIEELAVEGSLTGDPAKIYHAIYYDPLTSAVLSLAEIKKMVKQMFLKNRAYLPQFKHIS